jgi:hypothetical protein
MLNGEAIEVAGVGFAGRSLVSAVVSASEC